MQNDQLTLRTAKKTDYWLHAKDIPGSHVIIRDAHPSEETLTEAALLAAYFSKYRLSSQVPVDYVQVKHVHKPNGAKPGYVIYENQRTLYVTPTEESIKKIQQNKASTS
ncbi:fibronectin binding protein A [Enterococcus faecalis M7]|nr:fibronectin binding protein A [Enterococcus faecalis OG1X]ELA05377.1 fibronectin binding protein A [Enterococcus faecalis M7]